MMKEIRVLIADDHPAMRLGLYQALGADTHLKVVAETGDGETTRKALQEYQPDVAVLDIYMPEVSGFGYPQAIAFDLVRDIQNWKLSTQVILLTSRPEPEWLGVARKLGVKGYVLKDSAIIEIIRSVKTVASGYYYYSPQLSSYLIAQQNLTEEFLHRYPGLDELTSREKEVLSLIATGRSSKEIASKLGIGEPGVNNHRNHICQKLMLEGPMALLRFVLAHKEEILFFCREE